MNNNKTLEDSVDAIMKALENGRTDKTAFLDVLRKANAKLEASLLSESPVDEDGLIDTEAE